LDRSALIKI